ncbi:hypothetical protein WN944_012117 [Citrus x changshan-huyou]|uniref:Sulfite exporter TauE/SafE family protein n=1 Tax=Citrus x changshan-huyou TaxID=2935761 RepID=A0AAP0MXA5_9ROSI|nr:sulfite exporter TauE/SafE family protein 5 isoform X1 [Citrus sinensis]KAH9748275.1 Sulfite exporter TauE/SafE family protein 5 [Citrus sinensis]
MYSKKSKTQNFLTSVTLFLAICITLRQSHAKETQTASDNQLQNRTQQWRSPQTEFQDTNLKLTARSAIAGVFCFIAASISSAGGIGGGGLYIPILTISAGLELRTATSFSAFMVTGGSIANVMCNMLGTIGGKSFIDYDIALLSEPCMLLGVSIGVICNLVFPEWLVTVLFAIFLAWSTFKTCTNGFSFWKLESENLKRDHTCGKIENGIVKDENCDGSEGVKSYEEPLLSVDESNQLSFPWMKLGVLVLVWFCFSVLYLFRGNRDGQGIITMKPCGVGYWILSSLQIPLAIAFTAWILCRKESTQYHAPNQQGIGDLTRRGTSNKLIFPLMALLAGILGGLFGIGGGMLISPLLLQIGTAPEVTAATCSFMVFFSSTMSAFQYLLLGMEQSGTALIFAIVCFVASLLGLLVVQKAIQEFGRASLIVFSVSIVMALSTVLITSFEALDIWRDYTSGNYMGFKLPC